MSKKLYEPGFTFLSNYLNFKYGIEVIQKPFAEDSWYPHLNKIYINQNRHWKDRLIALIHESGHVQLDKNKEFKKSIKYKDSIFYTADRIRTKSEFIEVVNEELLAWNLGKMLAQDLNVHYDPIRLDFTASNCVLSYIKSGLQSVYGKTINVDQIYPHV